MRTPKENLKIRELIKYADYEIEEWKKYKKQLMQAKRLNKIAQNNL